jgi:cobalt-zinc-cadmium efflux system membrane fusion protein
MKSYIYILLSVLFLTACQNTKHTHDDHDEATHQEENHQEVDTHHQDEEHDHDENEISVSVAQFKANKMQLGNLQTYTFSDYLTTTGIVNVPPKNKATISPFYGGYVKTINLINGDYVKRGQLLFTLENPDFIQLQQDFLQAKEQLTYLKLDYERQKQLADEQIASQKKYLKAKSDYYVTKSQYQSLKKKLQMLHINTSKLSDENIRSMINIYAPISGYISDISIEKGAFLSPERAALKIVNTSHKHIELKVFEKDLHKIKKGQKVIFNLQNDIAKKFTGKIHLIEKKVDAQKRFINVHVHIDDEKNIKNMLPMMYVDAKIVVQTHQAKGLPETAVIDKDDEHFVLLQTETEEDHLIFEAKEVHIGDRSNGQIEIISATDFTEEDKLLLKGGFFLIGVGGGHQHDH